MHRNTRTHNVRKAYRKHMLAQICTMPEERFGATFGMATVHVNQAKPADYYHYRDNGARVLAVAHLDTVVMRHRRAPAFYDTKNGPMIRSGALDDRLGAYVILGLLPKLGISTDVLLTVGEESAQSTAAFFEPAKDYDWVIEFDRAGTDVVMYQYEDGPSCRAVEASGARVGFGSYSDIAYLEHLGVKAFNWGVGYQGNYHSEHGFAYLNDTFGMVAKYLKFHEQNAGVTMPHDPAQDDSIMRECPVCCALDSVRYGLSTAVCDVCLSCIDCEAHYLDCQCYIPQSQDRPRAYEDDYTPAKRESEDGPGWASVELDKAWEARHGSLTIPRRPRIVGISDEERRARAMIDAATAFYPCQECGKAPGECGHGEDGA